MSQLTPKVMLQVAIEFWGIIICLVASAGLLVANAQIRARRLTKICMEVLCVLLLLNDSIAWLYRGQEGTVAWYAVRISNFMVFFIEYCYMALFAHFLWESVSHPDEKLPKILFAVYCLSAVGNILLIISQFSELYYYIDENNLYHRGSYYLTTQILGFLGIFCIFTTLMRYKDRVEKPVLYAMMSYFVLPVLSTFFQALFYGISLQIISIVVSTQFIFAVDIVNMSHKLDRSQKDFLEASHAAEHDAMTDLLNKAAGSKYIKRAIEELKDGDGAALVFMDIDNFKAINDTYGHSTGDYWIIKIAKILQAVCTSEDIACRFGGDEFVVLYRGSFSTSAILRRVRFFQETLEEYSIEKGMNVHCSFGVCKIEGAGHSFDECVELADKQLYEAKFSGKNSCCVCEA